MRIFLCLTWLISQTSLAEFIPPKVNAGNLLEFKFLTVGLGRDLASRYGHTMLRVKDKENNLDYIVNWGLFDFSDPLFAPKFYLGNTRYRMGFTNVQNMLNHYKNFEKRPVWQHDLNLTALQRVQLLNKIIWNAQPENIEYPYQYFFNNCATIPRDYINEIYNNKIRERFSRQKITLTFRDYVFNYLSYNPFVGFGLDILFSSFNDRPISAWEEMFFPIKLMEYFEETETLKEDSDPQIPSKLITNKVTLVDLDEPPFPSTNPYFYFVLFFIPLLAFANLVSRITISMLALATASLVWGLLSGFFGFTHVFVWAFSKHFTAYHNVNLFLFWPVDILFAWFGVRLLVCVTRSKSRVDTLWILRLCQFHFVGCALYLVSWGLGLFEQNINRVLVFVVPVFILYYATVIKHLKTRVAGATKFS